jgi:hypothetical protein
MTTKTPSQFDIDLAAVCGTTPKNNDKLTEYKAQAKTALKITAHTRSLTADDKAAIINWHKARLSLASEQQADIETIAPAVGLHIDTTLIPIRINNVNIEQVETIPPAVELDTALQAINTPLTELEQLKQENAKLQARLAAIDAKHAPTYGFNEQVRLSVKVENNPVQIAIDGFYLNALMTMAGIDKAGCKTWIQAAVDGWGAFDAKLNITKQVRCLIVRELESQLIKARG